MPTHSVQLRGLRDHPDDALGTDATPAHSDVKQRATVITCFSSR